MPPDGLDGISVHSCRRADAVREGSYRPERISHGAGAAGGKRSVVQGTVPEVDPLMVATGIVSLIT
jgi:hypothetical protein